MYQRNIDMLYGAQDFDFSQWRPSDELAFQKKSKKSELLRIKDINIQVNPTHIFTFEIDEEVAIGAIWFVAKLDGYRREELGMFTDILYRYLEINFSKDYQINPLFCIAVDVFKGNDINYSQLESKDVPFALDTVIDEITSLL